MRIQPATILSLFVVSASLSAHPADRQTAFQSALVAATAQPASSAENPLTTVDEVLERYRAATGGSDVWSTFSTRATKGIYQTENLLVLLGLKSSKRLRT